MSSNATMEKRASDVVYVVDDDASIRDGLTNLLEAVGVQAECYESAEALAAAWGPDKAGCLLLDARLPGMSGVDFQDKLRKMGISIPIIFMTAHGDIAMVKKVMKAGAIEFLTKPFQKEELLEAVEEAFAVDHKRRGEDQVQRAIKSRIDSLSSREREVMSMVTVGMLNKQIASELGLSEITVKLHRRHMMEKMGASSLAELVKMSERVKTPTRNSRRK